MPKQLSSLGYVRRSIGFTPEDLASIDRMAKQEGLKRSAMVRKLITEYSDRHYPKSA